MLSFGGMIIWVYECVNAWVYECMNVWVYECMNAWICQFYELYIYTDINTHLCTYIHNTHTHIYTCEHEYTCTHTNIQVYTCIHMYTHRHTRIHMYTHTFFALCHSSRVCSRQPVEKRTLQLYLLRSTWRSSPCWRGTSAEPRYEKNKFVIATVTYVGVWHSNL